MSALVSANERAGRWMKCVLDEIESRLWGRSISDIRDCYQEALSACLAKQGDFACGDCVPDEGVDFAFEFELHQPHPFESECRRRDFYFASIARKTAANRLRNKGPWLPHGLTGTPDDPSIRRSIAGSALRLDDDSEEAASFDRALDGGPGVARAPREKKDDALIWDRSRGEYHARSKRGWWVGTVAVPHMKNAVDARARANRTEDALIYLVDHTPVPMLREALAEYERAFRDRFGYAWDHGLDRMVLGGRPEMFGPATRPPSRRTLFVVQWSSAIVARHGWNWPPALSARELALIRLLATVQRAYLFASGGDPEWADCLDLEVPSPLRHEELFDREHEAIVVALKRHGRRLERACAGVNRHPLDWTAQTTDGRLEEVSAAIPSAARLVGERDEGGRFAVADLPFF